jgi:hypothetical protein
MKAWGRWVLAGAAGLAATVLLNILAVWWLGATLFSDPAFYDGCAALLTLAIPAFAGGLLMGLLAREAGQNVSAIAFALFTIVGFAHRFWLVPPVSPYSAHSRLMHFLLYWPLIALACGALGGWLGQQFATGKYTLADRETPRIPGMED